LPLTAGSRLGIYEVTAAIGEGGMGQVYRARDTRLNRDVALKILPDVFAGDADRLARFTREAQTLASLNHPNIAHIHGLEESNGLRALVMELVEGEDLSQRIARGAIPLDEAIPIATQIAEALEAAHEQGIIHRDLKPANIKVRADGVVKVLDFGLAKAMEPMSAMAAGVSMSPTITTPAMMTGVGTILGTAAYMSPEQARGRSVDKRADVWAFGAVLFEMLTSRRAFAGEDITDTIVSVVSKEPDWPALPPSTSASVRSLLRRCLDKDPRRRLRDIGEARLALESTFETAAPQTTSSAPSTAPRGPVAWIAAIAAVAIVALAIPALRHLRETPRPETRTEINTPATSEASSFALSPDGRQIVFVASGDGRSHLWLRSLAATTAQPLAGTDGATYPFWAPDGRAIGFFAEGALKRLDIGGGGERILAQAINGSGGTWNADGDIVFAPSLTTPLMRVPATGGAAVAVTAFGPQQSGHTGPYFLPDGRRFLFYAYGGPEVDGIYLGGLDGRAPTRLAAADGSGVFLPENARLIGASRAGGWVLWVREGMLVGQQLDSTKDALVGETVTLADSVADRRFLTAASVTTTGLVGYRTGGGSRRQLTWMDRSGTARGTVGDPDGTFSNPRVSPDGRQVVVVRQVQGNYDLWVIDGARTTRFTFDTARDDFPTWSPDGTRIAFRSTRTSRSDLYQKLTSGAGTDERLVTSDQLNTTSSWSADGRFLLYMSADPQTLADIWVLPMLGDRKPSVVLKTPFRELWGTFSPDGRWVAYQSNGSGPQPEIYVRPFVEPGATGAAATGGYRRVSTAGGIMPAWRPDGKELYYLNPAGAIMAAPIAVTGPTIEPGAPVMLFPTRIFGGGVDAQQGRQYDVAPDGRFLINTELENSASPITLLMNWNPEGKK